LALGPTLSERGGSLRAALIAAAIATVIVSLDLFSAGIRWACLALIVVIAALTSSERRRPGSGWWDIYVAGAGVAILGALLAGADETVGGIVAIVGGAMLLVACAVGFPPGE
jgi:hypothetical protein